MTLRIVDLDGFHDHEAEPEEKPTYGGEPAATCDQCGHVSPTAELLARHLIRDCCGLLGRAA